MEIEQLVAKLSNVEIAMKNNYNTCEITNANMER
jgi:hypothetical protein